MSDKIEVKLQPHLYINQLSKKHQLKRLIWSITWKLLASWIPRSMLSGWKRVLLRSFGAKIANSSVIYSTAKIYYPQNLYMGEYACLASEVECYNVAPIKIGAFATVSQGAFLCTASHDISSSDHSLITKSIVVERNAWIGAEAFIGMGITIGEGAVVGARAAVFKNVDPWTVVGGNPARFLKNRIIKDA